MNSDYGRSMDRRRITERRYSYGYGEDTMPEPTNGPMDRRPFTGSLERCSKMLTDYPRNLPQYGGGAGGYGRNRALMGEPPDRRVLQPGTHKDAYPPQYYSPPVGMS